MATLWITETNRLATDGAGQGIVVQLGSGQTQIVVIGASSTQSNPLLSSTKLCRIFTDTACTIMHGANPVADRNSIPLAANQTEFFGFSGGGIAVILRS